LALINDDKKHGCPHSPTCGATLYRIKHNPDDLALAVQAASPNQAASKLEQLMVDCGRANRQFTLAEGQQEMLTRLAVVFGLGVRVLAFL
jgi:hypothetical protein